MELIYSSLFCLACYTELYNFIYFDRNDKSLIINDKFENQF